MSNFDKQSLESLEKLCRIKLTSQEEVEFLDSIKEILDYVEQMNEIDTEGVAPCNYVLKEMQMNTTREDKVGKTLPREEFLSNAPEQIGGMIRIPPVMKQ